MFLYKIYLFKNYKWGYQIPSEFYINKIPILIGVLNGAFLFMADLARQLSIQFEIDFIKIEETVDMK